MFHVKEDRRTNTLKRMTLSTNTRQNTKKHDLTSYRLVGSLTSVFLAPTTQLIMHSWIMQFTQKMLPTNKNCTGTNHTITNSGHVKEDTFIELLI